MSIGVRIEVGAPLSEPIGGGCHLGPGIGLGGVNAAAAIVRISD